MKFIFIISYFLFVYIWITHIDSALWTTRSISECSSNAHSWKSQCTLQKSIQITSDYIIMRIASRIICYVFLYAQHFLENIIKVYIPINLLKLFTIYYFYSVVYVTIILIILNI